MWRTVTGARLRFAKHLGIVLAAFVYAASVLLGLPGRMAAGDSLYHFSVASSIWHGDLAPDPSRTFPWGLWHDVPVDHYWGFHLLVAPFAAFGDPEVGMKVAAASLFAVFVGSVAVVAERRGAWLPWAWAAASVLFVTGQDWRYLQLRGGVLMATLLLAFVEIAFFVEDDRKRRIGVLALTTASALAYNGAFVLLPLHLAGLGSLGLLPDRRPARARLVDPLLTATGLVLALVVNPYFDRRLSTFRFAFLNVWVIGRDAGKLFVGQDNLESNPFPIALLVTDWSWGLLLAFVLVGILVVAWRLVKKEAVARDEVVYGALAIAAAVLTARMFRIREYSVPLAVLFLAVSARPLGGLVGETKLRLVAPAAVLALVVGAALREVPQTRAIIERAHPPIDHYAGAREILRANGSAPVANLVLGDGNLLLWEWPSVTVAQGGSPYFAYLYDRPLYDDLHTLRDGRDDVTVTEALERMRGRGSHLVSVRAGLPFHGFAARHPDRVRRVFLHARHRAALYEILPPAEPLPPPAEGIAPP